MTKRVVWFTSLLILSVAESLDSTFGQPNGHPINKLDRAPTFYVLLTESLTVGKLSLFSFLPAIRTGAICLDI